MVFKAFIEIPKGDTRRRHMNNDKSGLIDLGPIKDKISINDGKCVGNYGYIVDTANEEKGDELDLVVLTSNKYKPGDELEVIPFAMLIREDLDHKVIASDVSDSIHYKTWSEIPKELQKLLLDFYGFSSPVNKIADQDETLEYIEYCKKIYQNQIQLQKDPP